MKRSNRLREWVEIIVVALVVALLIENYIFGFAVVQGSSMEPTIKNNDRLLVIKFAYNNKEPQVGDLVIFTPPGNHKKGELFVKRIVAKEEEHFALREGILHINDEVVEEDYVRSEEYIQRVYPFVQGIVPKNSVFVMGDNRNDSNDSRNFGFIEEKQIKGKVVLRVWPLNEITAFVGKN
ncbi:signal peptidase I [Alkaliphilus transvaalensis]|uniref:signal peptidase I n=1 Tax=Alkaliphilus transvaalensis TaxID=114628 RepID=UPI00047D9F95|nr:signal peptidase I [Alkaliphilus transvaalensis]